MVSTANTNITDTVLRLLGATFVYCVSKALYQVLFHPLSSVPGDWYAVCTSLYEFWWNCPKSGRYFFKVEEMHRKYGPIVRINPWEVHINDPAFWDILYSNSRMEKDPIYYGGFGINGAAVATVSPDLHRIRRGAYAQFFSKAHVGKLEPRVLSRVKQLCTRIEQHMANDKAIDIQNAYRCLATDIITDYAAPKTRNFLDSSDFAAVFNRVLRDTAGIINWNRHIPIIYPLITSIPRGVIAFLDPQGQSLAIIDNQNDLLSQARAVVEQKEQTKETPTVLNAIYTSTTLPAEQKSFTRIWEECVTIIGAGTETTGNTLSVLTYYVIANPSIQYKLKKELEMAAADSGTPPDGLLTIRTLEPLPYLKATMKEALRVSSSVVGRLPRRNPTAAMIYTAPSGKTYTLPPNTVVSMSIRDMHFNESIFPEPKAFNPDRWIDASPAELAQMERGFVPFGKGVRQCVGLDLAKQEILLVAGNLFWKYHLELFDTTERDVSTEHDFFSPFAPADSKGVRVKVCSSDRRI
ncbi:putative cytochrome P450 [Lindgomyces ingoldianus]|uniref:Cytochrome P450 n=1 Tax=Lindgomyces ingoldianus TaxID=673940 RepID=A0ACB6QQY4_9PLEO|nr:putative cytochrome P450 [Lindgomyces ingoldianus]KAF2468983.1 putative cytochrome P450 [Lindgomyces ingoldianus]